MSKQPTNNFITVIPDVLTVFALSYFIGFEDLL